MIWLLFHKLRVAFLQGLRLALIDGHIDLIPSEPSKGFSPSVSAAGSIIIRKSKGETIVFFSSHVSQCFRAEPMRLSNFLPLSLREQLCQALP